MRSKRPFVIVTRKLPDPIETRMMELFTCRLNLDDKPFDKSELIAAVGRADVLVPTVTDRIDAEVLAAAGPALKLIASFGTGIDHVGLAAARGRGKADPQRWLDGLGPDLDARPPNLGQAARHSRHGPDRHGARPPREGFRAVGPLPQPPPRA